MSIILKNPVNEINQAIVFIQSVLDKAETKNVVIAVSGGIDSALSLGLLTKTIPVKNIYPIFLPYAKQNMRDARLLVTKLNIPESNWQEVNIGPIVDKIAKLQKIEKDKLRLGNVMARSRMIIVYDIAKKLNALVCGTENKSEKYLGYFTRFGDEASDFEPIVHLYKSQVRQLVEELNLPKVFLTKAPSAGLWKDQTDEQELGFSYQIADQVIEAVIIGKQQSEAFSLQSGIDLETVTKVVSRVQAVHFKHEVPYTL